MRLGLREWRAPNDIMSRVRTRVLIDNLRLGKKTVSLTESEGNVVLVTGFIEAIQKEKRVKLFFRKTFLLSDFLMFLYECRLSRLTHEAEIEAF